MAESDRQPVAPGPGRRVLFAVGPSPIVIVSVNGIAVNADSADAMTDANGRISVVVLVRGILEIGAQAAADGAQEQMAEFDLE